MAFTRAGLGGSSAAYQAFGDGAPPVEPGMAMGMMLLHVGEMILPYLIPLASLLQ